MNEQKIKELVLAAGAEYHFGGDILVNNVHIFAEKLIELTVKECISVLEEEIYKSIDNEGDEIWADLILNKHFGVDE
jgi:hypothetical protein